MIVAGLRSSRVLWAEWTDASYMTDRVSLMPHRAQADNFASLAREFAKQPTLAATLQAVVVHTVATIEGAEDAAITIRRSGGKFQTIAATSDLPIRVDEVQYRTQEGPCLQALTDRHVLRSDDLASDPRWPAFGRLASDKTEVVSMMSHRLMLEEEHTIGALNMYSRKPAAFAPLDLSVLDELATHAAIALTLAASREQNENLRRALESNRTIGIAIGVLMTTKFTTRQQAFDLLRIASQRSHIRLYAVAEYVIEAGALPGG
jgi:GAF domain-containing protein